MFVAENRNRKTYALQAKDVNLLSKTDERILQALSKKPAYPKMLAKRLGIDEQSVYYHIKCMEKKGLIKVTKKEERGAAIAKIYSLTKPAFVMKFSELKETNILPKENDFLEPFIIDGKMNAKIIVGSPDPHGPERARSRDAAYAIDLGIFLGTFITESREIMKIDSEIHKSELSDNLILVGGPLINKITKMINEKMPLRFKGRNIYSSFTKMTYKSDDTGMIVKMSNPFDRSKKILVIAGKRFSGTRASILAFVKKFDEISGKNNHIVLGIDADYDGIVDDVKILE